MTGGQAALPLATVTVIIRVRVRVMPVTRDLAGDRDSEFNPGPNLNPASGTGRGGRGGSGSAQRLPSQPEWHAAPGPAGRPAQVAEAAAVVT
jgi:hypothetical protein